ncbi:hypothetical protein [Nocardia rhizosphaerae]|uniref:DUF8017 domain-containing protein n=1 Tax=Nocardia rhizosphaerae TaxID=1691571 RepID=A0ABV8L100_9NOCA
MPGPNPWNPVAGQANQGPNWSPSDPTVLGGQQYGEVPPLEQFGGQSYGYRPAPKSGNKTVVWIAVGAAAVVLAGGITAFALTRGGASTASGPTPSMVSALTTTVPPPSATAKPSTSTPAPTGAAAGRTPVIKGYQVVASPDRGAAYDVPPGWDVAAETTIGGVGGLTSGDAVVGKGFATHGEDYCPGSTRTMSLLTGSKQADHAVAGAELGKKAAALGYRGSTGTPGPAEPLTSIDGKTSGMFTETTGAIADPEPGCGSTYSVYAYAFDGAKEGSFVMVMIADTGVPDAIDATEAKRIFSSIRALD